MDIAASIQDVVETIAIKLVLAAKELTRLNNIVFAGGVFLNCRMNQKIVEQGLFEKCFFYPCPGDAGAAIGAGFLGFHEYLRHPIRLKQNTTTYLGNNLLNKSEASSIESELKQLEIPFIPIEDNFRNIAKMLSEGKIVAWADGAMEFGARALGHRSIFADPRSADMQKILNEKIKLRENFRPFAPVIIDKHASRYFILHEANYNTMMVTATAMPGIQSIMPAIVHADGSSRIQVLSELDNPTLYLLLSEFYSLTGCPALINTSFNVRGEPIVSNLMDCLQSFLYTEIDALVLGAKYMITKFTDLRNLKNKIPPHVYPTD